jgi:hypothetical protein
MPERLPHNTSLADVISTPTGNNPRNRSGRHKNPPADYSNPPKVLHKIFNNIATGMTAVQALRGTGIKESQLQWWIRRSKEGLSPCWIHEEYKLARIIAKQNNSLGEGK